MNQMNPQSLPVAVNGKVHTASSVDVEAGTISLRGILPDDVPVLWGWLNEIPEQNFDDYGPQSLADFKIEIQNRLLRGEFIVIALHDGEPVGCMAYLPLAPHIGTLHGICFAKKVHRKGVAPFAVRQFIKIVMKGTQTQKICAAYFQSNSMIKKFLRAQGFVHEGLLVNEGMRGGKLINKCLVALHRKTWEAMQTQTKGVM